MPILLCRHLPRGPARVAVGAAIAMLLAFAGSASAAKISVRGVRSAPAALRAGTLTVGVRGPRNFRGRLVVSGPNPARPARPAYVPLAPSRFFSLGRSRRATVTLRLDSRGRRVLRVLLAGCRPLAMRARIAGRRARKPRARRRRAATRSRRRRSGRRLAVTRPLRLSGSRGCAKRPGSSSGGSYPGALGGLSGLPGFGRPAFGGGPGAHFRVGAAVADVSPPARGQAPGGDPADCDPTGTFGGPRPFAFTEPYQDGKGSGHYNGPYDATSLVGFPPSIDPTRPPYPGDPYLDCNHNGRWEGNLIGGGGAPRYYDKVADPVTARAMVVSNGAQTMAVEVVDQEGLFNVYQQQIRDRVAADGYPLENVFISATHDESAPDSLGLGGVNSTTSGVNDYWLSYFINRSVQAIEQAYQGMRSATIRYSETLEPANVRQCWSSYPYTDDQRMPILQAVGDDGRPIVTLADVSQHTETLAFNNGSQVDPGNGQTLAAENRWLSADWPFFFRSALESHYGGVAIEMAGSVGSVESPQVFGTAIARTPEHHVNADHPAGCNTLFGSSGEHVALGYSSETAAYGVQTAAAVIQAFDSGSYLNSVSNRLWGQRADVCVPIENVLFAAGAASGVFAHRPAYSSDCSRQIPPGPNGAAAGQAIQTQVASFGIGDGQFVSIPGEVFPFTYLRGFQGPQDMPDGGAAPLSPWLMPHLSTRFRFLNGLAEDMIGYIFPPGNAVGIPTQSNPNPGHGDRFGCGHSDDSEAASSQSGTLLGQALVPILDGHGGGAEAVARGRFVLGDGTPSRNPEGHAGPASSPGEVRCDSGHTDFRAQGSALGVELADGTVVHPQAWMSLSGLPQSAPDRDTRGYFDEGGNRVWLEVYPDLSVP